MLYNVYLTSNYRAPTSNLPVTHMFKSPKPMHKSIEYVCFCLWYSAVSIHTRLGWFVCANYHKCDLGHVRASGYPIMQITDVSIRHIKSRTWLCVHIFCVANFIQPATSINVHILHATSCTHLSRFVWHKPTISVRSIAVAEHSLTHNISWSPAS